MDSLLKDLKYALRSLLQYPSFSTVAVVTIALGIGANTAIFTVVNAVLLRPLPYSNAERLMMVGSSTPSTKLFAATRNRFFYWREQSQSFEALTTFRSFSTPALSGAGEAVELSGLRVSEDFFKVFAIQPQLGRTFSTEEDVSGGPNSVIISDRVWKHSFGAATDVTLKSLTINNQQYSIVGVMPPDFWFEVEADLITPLRLGTTRELLASGANYPVVGRLKVGVSKDQALSEMKVIAERFSASHPEEAYRGEGASVVDYQEYLVGDVRRPLLILLGAVALVLLIACANVANLQLSSAISRGKEIAIRAALGASRARLVRQLLTEGILLSFIGGFIGLMIAFWGVPAFRTVIPEGLIPRQTEIGFNASVLIFTTVASLFAGILFGVAPAFHSTRLNLTQAIKDSPRGGSGTSRYGLFRSALIVSQVSLALVLLIGAVLLIKTFANLRGVDPGFDPTGVLTFDVVLRGQQYATTAQIAQFNQQAVTKIKSLPGVEAVATTSTLPLRRWLNLPMEFEGNPDQVISAEWRMISPQYFDVMKMRITDGRNISESDSATSIGVAVVNEAFVRRYFQTKGTLGQRVIIGRTMGKDFARPIPLEIVGIVSDNKQTSLIDPALPTIYVPTAQVPDALIVNFRSFYFVVRTTGEPLSFVSGVRQEMFSLDSNLPLRNMRALEEVVASSISKQRFQMSLLALFGAIGLVLSAVGIYGVMAYSVFQRTREIGIRMALGAQLRDMLRMVLVQAMKLTLIGVGLGLAGSIALTRVLKSLLFGVQPTDLATHIIVAFVLLTVALIASYIPARRATRVDPLVALRYE